MRVAAYVRMSTEHQRYSISNQLLSIEAYCRDHQCELVRIYSDAGRSGLTAKRRPGLTTLIDDAKRGGLPFSAVIVLDVSRWGRFQNVDEGAYFEHILKRAGAPVRYCAEAFENDGSPGSTIIKAVKRAMAAEYSRELSAKSAQGARRIAEEGWRACGAAGLGYRRIFVDENGRVIHRAERGERKAIQSARTKLTLGPPEEVETVQRIFDLYVSHLWPIYRIADEMAREARPSPTPNGWSKELVGLILRNEKYVGDSVYGKTTAKLQSPLVKTAPRDWIVIEGAHPPIISRELFEAAQRRRNRRAVLERSEILKGLRRLFKQYGMVSRGLIDAAPYLPSKTYLCKAFGSLAEAYAAAKLPQVSLSEQRRLTRERTQSKDATRVRATKLTGTGP